MKLVQKLVQYILPLALALLLLGYAYRDIRLDELMLKLQKVDLRWIGLSVMLGSANYVLRAYRWKLLLQSTGYSPSVLGIFVASMIGSVSNLFLPRIGELVRCSLLKKLKDIPVSISLGTVVAEKVIDLSSLIAIASITLILEFGHLKASLHGVGLKNLSLLLTQRFFIFVTLCLLLTLLVVVLFKGGLRESVLFREIEAFLKELCKGLTSLRKMTKELVGVTVLIWTGYFFTSYSGLFSIPETSGLGWVANLSILTMGGISMVVPVQGALGAYQLLVTTALMTYGIPREEGILYVTLMYSSQLLLALVLGGLCALSGTMLSRKQA